MSIRGNRERREKEGEGEPDTRPDFDPKALERLDEVEALVRG